MIANAAFLAGVTVFLLVALAGRRTELSWRPTRPRCFAGTAGSIGGAALLLFFNLCALYYSVARWLFLRDTGRNCCTWTGSWGRPTPSLEDLGPQPEP